MILNSDYKDYYDEMEKTGMGFGDNITYARYETVFDVSLSQEVIRWLSDKPRPENLGRLKLFYIGFCGKIYPGLNILNEYVYTLTGAFYIPKKHGIIFNDKEKEIIQEFFKIVYYDNHLFLELNAPIFTIEREETTKLIVKVNPPLENYQFIKVNSKPKSYKDVASFLILLNSLNGEAKCS